MTRMGKQEERRNMNPKKRKPCIFKKTGPKKDALNKGYKVHENALSSQNIFIAKVK